MQYLKFGKCVIGGASTIIIAEIADSHNGDLATAKKMVDEVKKAGADVAKFQLHLPDIEMVPGSIQMWDGPLYDILKRNLFTPEMHKEIMDYCENVGVEYLCTPFCPDAVDILNEMGVKAFKTGSGELTHLPIQRKIAKICAQRKIPAIISTGMCTWDEIIETVHVYEEEGTKDYLILMNCTSEYPPNDYSHVNLGLIRKFQREFSVWVGQSDHTMDNYTTFAAVALGVKVVEKHFTLSRDQKGPDHAIALEPSMLKELVGGIRKIEVALGNEKIISKEEAMVRSWAYHSIVAEHIIHAGEEITLDNIVPKRPGTGIPAKYLDRRYIDAILGKKAKHDLVKNTIIQWKDIV